MTLMISVQDYISALSGFENLPVSMEMMLRPFRLSFPSLEEPTLVMGLVLDCLSEEFLSSDLVDPFDIAFIASEIGYDEALRFLNSSPEALAQQLYANDLRRGASQS